MKRNDSAATMICGEALGRGASHLHSGVGMLLEDAAEEGVAEYPGSKHSSGTSKGSEWRLG